MIRYTVTVPLIDNDGAPIPDDTLLAIDNRALNVADGFSRHDDGIGVWRSPRDDNHVVYREPNRVYTIDTDGMSADVDGWKDTYNVKRLAQFVAIACAQVCVYVTAHDVHGLRRWYVTGDDDL